MKPVVADSLLGTRSRIANAAARLLRSIQSSGLAPTILELRARAAQKRRRNHDGHAPAEAEALLDRSACTWLDAVPSTVEAERIITPRDLAAFMEHVHYPRYYYGGMRRIRYALWHMIGFERCALHREAVVVDVGAQAGIWGDLARRNFGCTVYDVDLRYRRGVHGWRIGASAGDIPLPNGAATHVVSHCAYNCFEARADEQFIAEAARLLAPGGKLVIVPLCIADEHVNLFDPAICQSEESFDRGARRVAWHGWGNNFGRWYDRRAFEDRVLRNARGLHFNVGRVRHPDLPCDAVSWFWAASFVKAPGATLSTGTNGATLS
jgi:hypothetical protein